MAKDLAEQLTHRSFANPLLFIYVRTHQSHKPGVFDMFVFSSACNQSMLFDVVLYPFVAFVLFCVFIHNHKTAWIKPPQSSSPASESSLPSIEHNIASRRNIITIRYVDNSQKMSLSFLDMVFPLYFSLEDKGRILRYISIIFAAPSDIAHFMRPVITIRFPIPGIGRLHLERSDHFIRMGRNFENSIYC